MAFKWRANGLKAYFTARTITSLLFTCRSPFPQASSQWPCLLREASLGGVYGDAPHINITCCNTVSTTCSPGHERRAQSVIMLVLRWKELDLKAERSPEVNIRITLVFFVLMILCFVLIRRRWCKKGAFVVSWKWSSFSRYQELRSDTCDLVCSDVTFSYV